MILLPIKANILYLREYFSHFFVISSEPVLKNIYGLLKYLLILNFYRKTSIIKVEFEVVVMAELIINVVIFIIIIF